MEVEVCGSLDKAEFVELPYALAKIATRDKYVDKSDCIIEIR